ncbi:GntR family transcriptional regulator [Microbacterium excoecariae]|uniref:GntR family transcriptional regulator n=1 Tax=Microbacterium excoecariae TaxID=2715210 RepID=UPI00140D0954|nr:GntR family transcriptional regulator [Microbacterium excoecariae]
MAHTGDHSQERAQGMFDPIEIDTPRLSDAAFRHIALSIVDGRLPQGERVRDEQISSELGVSRMPVREAMQHLERLGLLDVRANRYTQVSRVTDAQVTDTLEYAGHYAAMTLRMALGRMDARKRSVLASSLAEIRDHFATDGDAPAARLAVLHLLLQLSSNEVARRFAGDIDLVTTRNLHGRGLETRDGEELAELLAVLPDAVAEGDADTSEALVRRHFGA